MLGPTCGSNMPSATPSLVIHRGRERRCDWGFRRHAFACPIRPLIIFGKVLMSFGQFFTNVVGAGQIFSAQCPRDGGESSSRLRLPSTDDNLPEIRTPTIHAITNIKNIKPIFSYKSSEKNLHLNRRPCQYSPFALGSNNLARSGHCIVNDLPCCWVLGLARSRSL